MTEIQQVVPDVLIWQRDPCISVAFRCLCCGGTGLHPHKDPAKRECCRCDSTGWFGIDDGPTCLHGSAKVPVLQYRYVSGIPIFNPGDRGDLT